MYTAWWTTGPPRSIIAIYSYVLNNVTDGVKHLAIRVQSLVCDLPFCSLCINKTLCNTGLYMYQCLTIWASNLASQESGFGEGTYLNFIPFVFKIQQHFEQSVRWISIMLQYMKPCYIILYGILVYRDSKLSTSLRVPQAMILMGPRTLGMGPITDVFIHWKF